MGNKSGSTTSQVNNAPWAGEAPFLAGQPGSILGPNGQPGGNSLYTMAGEIGNTPLQFPGFQTYASPTSAQNQAIQSQIGLGQNDPVTQAAMGGIQPYLNGSMLSGGNPYLGNAVNQVAQSIQPSIDSNFNMNGRAGSGANNQAFASSLANAAGQMAYQNYNDQSTNQLKAMLEAPSVSGAAFSDIGNVASAGAQQQAFNQLPITQQLQQYQFNQMAPFTQASMMQSLLGNGITSSSSTNPYFTNPVGSAIGTGTGALGLYNAFNQAGGTNGVSSLYNNLFGGLGGAGGSGLSQAAMDSLSSQAAYNIAGGAAGL